MTTYVNIHEALEARMGAMGLSLDDFAWTAMLDELKATGLDPSSIDEDVFAGFLRAHELERGPIGPCPSWCDSPPGHRWDSYRAEDKRQLRSHSRTLGEHADLVLEEYTNTPLHSQPITLRVYVEEDCKDWTAAEVRALAAELLNAADELDKVTAAKQWTEDQL